VIKIALQIASQFSAGCMKETEQWQYSEMVVDKIN
jgi:hypothetical protein